MKLSTMWRAVLLLAALAAFSCGREPGQPVPGEASENAGTSTQEINSSEKVLLLGPTVTGGTASREAQAALSAGYAVDVVTPEQWSAMSAQQFMEYAALIIGDSACQTSEAAFAAAVTNRHVWGDIVDGNVVIIGADPVANDTPHLVENAIKFAAARPYVTGMYVALGCAYKDASGDTSVDLLEPFGTFLVAGVGCANTGHMPQMSDPTLTHLILDPTLTGDGCAARTVFTMYPDRTFAFAALGVSTHTSLPGEQLYEDFEGGTTYVGAPFILVRGASAYSAGCGTTSAASSEECDLGDFGNGIPALPGQPPEDTCSDSCRRHWCGDGVVDAIYGEECDEGYSNGRDFDGNLGTCTKFCKLVDDTPPASNPPSALCQDVMMVAQRSCGSEAYIDAGSNDSDGDLVGCTQSPAGPYPMGTTTVTLTCVDAANHSSSCQAVVTVLDRVVPAITLNGPEAQTLACGADYTEPGATAYDACEGDVSSNITITSDLDRFHPGEYTTTYRVTDSTGNMRYAFRQITVEGPCSNCIEVRLSDYNLFLLGDYTGGHDMNGKVAVGGNVTLTDFALGHTLPEDATEKALVVGGDLTLARGGVWGEAWFGGSYSADSSVVFPQGDSASQGTPIDFAARFAELRGLSSQLAELTANGTTKRETWGGVMLTGTNPELNVFDVNASAFTGAVLLSINAPAGSLVVVNIRGASATFQSFGHSFSGGIDQHGILYNFVDATSITASNYGFFGTVLAPYAHVNFNNGSFDGGLYAVSLTGNAEGHINVLYDRDICP
jgi:choice-of-anchor A domain-containing protein